MSEDHQTRFFEPGPIAAVAIASIAVICFLAYPFASIVGPGEIVVRDCDGSLTVWRHDEDGNVHWDGLCRTRTYAESHVTRFDEVVDVDGASISVRGKIVVSLPADDRSVRALHEEFGSEKAILAVIEPGAMDDVRAAANEPSWHRPKGGWFKRELKGAFEYAIRRFSPTGAIWSTRDAKRALQESIQARLDAREHPQGVTVKVELGFVTER